MGVACHAGTLTAAGFVEELEAHREEEGKDELDKRVWGVEERQVGRLIVKVDGDGPVVACRVGGLSHGSPPVPMALRPEGTWGGERIEKSSGWGKARGCTTTFEGTVFSVCPRAD